MSETKRTACACKHNYQDLKYGKGKRVHNKTEKGTGKVVWRCTVCGTEKSV